MNASEQGYILSAQAYPCDDQFLVFDLLYTESAQELNSNQYKMRRFHVRKDIAKMLAKNVTDILAAPDAETAWANIDDKLVEHCDQAVDIPKAEHE